MTDVPEIIINFSTLWCRKHLDRFRKHWPQGYMPASMCLFNQVAESEEALEYAGGDVGKLNAYLAEFGPFCCKFESILPELFEFAGDIPKPRFHEIMKKYSFSPPDGWKDEEETV